MQMNESSTAAFPENSFRAAALAFQVALQMLRGCYLRHHIQLAAVLVGSEL